MTSFIREYTDVLTPKQCEALILFFEHTVNSGSAFLQQGNKTNGGGLNRKDTALYLQEASSQFSEMVGGVVASSWEKYVDEFNFLENLSVYSFHQKLQRTPPRGGFHRWHWEHSNDSQYRDRIAVWTLYLTTHEDEGETEFLAHGLKVKPEAGKMCVFPADFTAVHRGNPVYTKNKYIITGWYHYAPPESPF